MDSHEKRLDSWWFHLGLELLRPLFQSLGTACNTDKHPHVTMPPLLKTYFNPRHRSFLQTLFTATFFGAVLVAAFPCPVRPGEGGFHRAVNQDGDAGLDNGGDDESARSKSLSSRQFTGRTRPQDEKLDVVVMMNERGRSKSGKSLFIEED